MKIDWGWGGLMMLCSFFMRCRNDNQLKNKIVCFKELLSVNNRVKKVSDFANCHEYNVNLSVCVFVSVSVCVPHKRFLRNY